MTAKQINDMSAEELVQLAEQLTQEENELWAFHGYEGRTYELIMRDRETKAKVERFRKELAMEL
jgi:hypothetical protein